MTPNDRFLTRLVRNQTKLIQEHLEAMQRDTHGVEYARWKSEVDGLWKGVFENVNGMQPESQTPNLEEIRELWTMYVTHYVGDQ
jgi:hypothetical protein